MHSLGDVSKSLNQSAVYVSGLQARFELPEMESAAYSNAYLAFLRIFVAFKWATALIKPNKKV